MNSKQKAAEVRLAFKVDQASNRSCGECKACCTVMGVEELKKPYYTPCPHVCEKGCAIYGNRPHTCRVWSCLWRMGDAVGHSLKMPDDMRPDQCGVLLTLSERKSPEFVGVVRPEIDTVLNIYELWEGAWDECKAKYPDLARFEEAFPCVVGNAYKRHLETSVGRIPLNLLPSPLDPWNVPA